jgi:hypothetical protein
MTTRSNVLLGPITLVGLVLASSPPASAAETKVFVSPHGNDAWSGKLPEANPDRSDGPLATPLRARDVVRMIRQAAGEAGPIQVILRGGTYFLPEPLVLTPADSGSADRPVIWCAFQGELPVLSGGRKVTGWSKTAVNGKDAWVAKLPGGASGPAIRELWLDGHRLARARWPKQGTLAVEGLSDPGKHEEWSRGVTEFRFAGQDIKPWPSAPQGEAIVTSRWVESHLPIQSVDASARVVRFTKRSVFLIDPGDRYWIENVKENLTDPGEFFVDANARTVTLITANGLDPNTVDVVAPHLAQVVRLMGKPEAG